ncbi:MAG: serine hydrolase [Verrucomicrobiota bacterium]|nr:serine hydrolase [Verrucomicrobiota bacterium]
MLSKSISLSQAPVLGLLTLFAFGQAHAADRFQHAQAKVFPGSQWARWPTPEAAGWSSAKLDAAQEHAAMFKTAAVMIVQGGMIVDEWGETRRPFKCHSMRKSILSALYGPHVVSGKIKRTSTLGELGIDDNAPSLSATEKQATVVDLLKARSGVYHPALYETKGMAAKRPRRGSHPPGMFWYYNNWDFNALGTIFKNQTGRGIYREFESRLAKPLGMQDFFHEKHTGYVTGADSIHAAYPFQLSARDIARFGLLFARCGRWGEHQIIPCDWVDESTGSYSTTERGGGYGYMWWVAANGKFYPNVALPDGAFSASGYRGHKMLVIPQWDLVIVHRVNTFEKQGSVSSAEFGRLVSLILAAWPRS